MTRRAATGLGFGAIALWALLALLTDLTGDVPPFQLAALTFGLAAIAGMFASMARGALRPAFRQPLLVWSIGVGGLFGYHFLYFTALRAAPPAEASLIAYLWPLLIVLGSTLVTKEGLKRHHLVGALLGLSGAVVLVSGRVGLSAHSDHLAGYGIALAAAFVWSGYSILSRRVSQVPTEAVTGFCIATAVLATFAHLAVEPTVWPREMTAWAAIVGLGLGPVGLAFFLWDVGMKHGDISLLGAASYLAPLLSTVLLVIFGRAELTWTLTLGCLLITLGALISAATFFRRPRSPVSR